MGFLIKNKYWEINKEYSKEKLLYLLIDRPDKIDIFNDFFWYNDKNQYHRNYDLPSFIDNIGDIWWYKNNKCHRENNKPAYIRPNGYKEYWSNHKQIKLNEF